MGLVLKGSITCLTGSDNEKQLKAILHIGKFDYQVEHQIEYVKHKSVSISFSKELRTIENEDLLRIINSFRKEARLQ
jgi:hypothetical protein